MVIRSFSFVMKEMKEISTKPAVENKSAKPTCSYYVGNIVFDIFGISTKSTAEIESAKPTCSEGNIAFGISGISTRLATEGKISEADFALTLK